MTKQGETKGPRRDQRQSPPAAAGLGNLKDNDTFNPVKWQSGLKKYLDELPDPELARQMFKTVGQAIRAKFKADGVAPILTTTADEILGLIFSEPVWAIPGLLPAGLTILAGKAKVGKSWLALQIALAVGHGGRMFDTDVIKGKVLYLALEDTKRRLQNRMNKQGWPRGKSAVEFIVLGEFQEQVGYLTQGGAAKLGQHIAQGGYRLVVIDTYSRAIGPGHDQNEVGDTTAALSTIQEIAMAHDCAVLILDHHNKGFASVSDVVGDILGSTGKGAVADAIWGLYRERGKPGAKLVTTGRDVEEKTLALTVDWERGIWKCEGEAEEVDLTEKQVQILAALKTLGSATFTEVLESMGGEKKVNRGNLYTRLQDLLNHGHLIKANDRYKLVNKVNQVNLLN